MAPTQVEDIHDGGVYSFRLFANENTFSDFAVDLDDGSSNNGTHCQAWNITTSSDKTVKNMWWKAHGPERHDNIDYWRFENMQSGTFLDMEPTKAWGKPQVWGWQNNGSDCQLWEIQKRGEKDQRGRIVTSGMNGFYIRNKGRDQWMAYGPLPVLIYNGGDIIGINSLIEHHYFYFVTTA